jgi:hypothetical protein
VSSEEMELVRPRLVAFAGEMLGGFGGMDVGE